MNTVYMVILFSGRLRVGIMDQYMAAWADTCTYVVEQKIMQDFS